ncbi:MAG: hypothetical protein K1Y36_29980 [Blastocatellia bacterium]|nr:hypothetical protein [Blastocatellia bacterium]HNG92017.1 hypothetical protein [Acidobacteriota bacterium]
MSKKVSFTSKPKPVKPSADEWVNIRQGEESEPLKRLTLDIPQSLHAKIKSQCALRGVKMVEEIRTILEKHFVTD